MWVIKKELKFFEIKKKNWFVLIKFGVKVKKGENNGAY